MGHRTRFTDLVGCEWPIQLAAMGGGVGGPTLAVAVTDAGGLGMITWTTEVADDRWGVNFLMPFLPPPAEIAAVAARVHVVEFFYGDPTADVVAIGHDAGAIVGWQVGSRSEALAAEAAGCDFIVAQGTEAGGHVRGSQSLDVVLAEVADAVTVPIVAAGGIASAERVAEIIEGGCDGVRIGTRFLACPESNAHETYLENLISASGADTVLTGWFDLGWPDAPHRVLRSALDAARVVDYHEATPPTRGESRPIAPMAQYAGAGVGEITEIRPAAEVMADLTRLLRPR